MGLQFKKNDTILVDSVYSWCVERDYVKSVCSYCLRYKASSTCETCKMIRYCCDKCKRKDFHSIECELLVRMGTTFLHKEDVRLNARTIERFALERNAENVSVGDFFGFKRTISDLVHHVDHLDEESLQQVSSIAEQLREANALAGSVSLEDAMELVQRCSINAQMLYHYSDGDMNGFARGVYLAASKFNHTCVMNTKFVQGFIGRKMITRAIADFQINSPLDLKMNYVCLNSPLEKRRERLQSQYFFHCDCEKCVEDESKNLVSTPEDIIKEMLEAEEAGMAKEKGYKLCHEYLKRLQALKPKIDENDFVYYNLFTYLQRFAFEIGYFEESIDEGKKALQMCKWTVTELEIRTLLQKAYEKLGWNEKTSEHYNEYIINKERTDDMKNYFLTHRYGPWKTRNGTTEGLEEGLETTDEDLESVEGRSIGDVEQEAIKEELVTSSATHFAITDSLN